MDTESYYQYLYLGYCKYLSFRLPVSFHSRGTRRRNGSGTATIILTGVKYNVGGHYSVSSGRFTCVYSGIYFFALNLYKARSANVAWCRIKKNGTWVVLVTAEPKSSTTWDGYLEASGSMVIHLAAGDTVELGECTPASQYFGTLLLLAHYYDQTT